ncbi:MAG TPA: metalloregulator ArsR/SmtB family transcription factor [Candidatus Dormibacteraeota bacterium]|nr:metalloregulator ArsR/SmtB family transcription factor [Candidatus Dormibacteraeota bacterium]
MSTRVRSKSGAGGKRQLTAAVPDADASDIDAEEVDLDGSLDPRLKLQLEELVGSMCKALNDAKRLMLLYALRDRPRSVTELCAILDLPQSNASQHLAVLRERGVVVTERRGNRVLYSLRYPAVIDAVDILRSVMAEELERQHRLHDVSVVAGS